MFLFVGEEGKPPRARNLSWLLVPKWAVDCFVIVKENKAIRTCAGLSHDLSEDCAVITSSL